MSAPASTDAPGQPPGMSRLVFVFQENGGSSSLSAYTAARARQVCAELEAGNILFFPDPPFAIPQEDRDFLLGRTQTSSALHKNIAYRPAEDRLTGLAKSEHLEAARLRLILRNY